MEKLDQLKEKVREITYLGRAAAVLGWDQQTYMPSGGAEDRGNQLAVLGSLTHRMFTSPEMGQLIEDCKPIVASMDPDSDDACLVRMLDKNYKKNTRVPTEHVAEFAQVTTLAQETWARARAASDFAAFRPYLERIVELRRQYASFFAPYDHVYDPLLDDFEPGLKTGDVQAIFGALRPQQVEIIQAITARPQVDDAFLHRTYPEQGQWDFGVDVITRFGYDWNRGRQDKSPIPSLHPLALICRIKPGLTRSGVLLRFSTMQMRQPSMSRALIPSLLVCPWRMALRWRSTSPNPACGKTWWGGRCPSGRSSSRYLRNASRLSWKVWICRPSTGASTRLNLP